MATLGAPDRRTCYQVFPDYWFAPGAQSHLHVPWVTGGSGNVFVMALPRATLLNAKELREHIELGLWNLGEGRWGQKNIQSQKKQLNFASGPVLL